MNLIKKHTTLGCLLLLLLLPCVVTGCKKNPENSLSAKRTVEAYCNSVLRSDSSTLVSDLGISKKEAKKISNAFPSAFESKIKKAATNVDATLSQKDADAILSNVLKQTKKIEYSCKEVSSTEDTATYEVSIESLDYSPLASTITPKIKDSIKEGKIKTTDQIKTAILDETKNYVKDTKPSTIKKTVQVTLKKQTVTIENVKVTRFLPEDEDAFVSSLASLIITYKK